MSDLFFKTSLFFNVIFIITLILFGFKFKELIYQKLIVKKGDATIVFFGDSIIKGGKWNKLLKRKDVLISAFGGFTTSHLRWLINDNVIKFSPEICFLQGGINDIGVGIPLNRIIINYKSLIDTLISNKITPIVQSTLYAVDDSESKSLIDSLNSFLIDYCNEKSIRYIDINSKLSNHTGLKPEYSTDGIHINESAYLVWASEIKELLKDL
jgi:lysophospholipase L1-like esterase